MNAFLTEREEQLRKRRREVFGDCALIEIIHLHDCLRGAIRSLERDVNDLEGLYHQGSKVFSDIERRIAGRFRVIWSVFQSHSKAEDQFIWPALKEKTQGRISGSPNYIPVVADCDTESSTTEGTDQELSVVGQQEYEEDHADEERMFLEMDGLLKQFRAVLVSETMTAETHPPGFQDLLQQLVKTTQNLSEHLMTHLEKEEVQCLPLVAKHLTKEEIHELVGSIMGQRSASMVVEIMTMAVQSLDEAEREEMVKYMKESMKGTYFDRWLTMTGWNGTSPAAASEPSCPEENSAEIPESMSDDRKRPATSVSIDPIVKRPKSSSTEPRSFPTTEIAAFAASANKHETSQEELERLIRTIATNKSLTPAQRNTTIQGLRDSVWRSNQQQKAAVAPSLKSEQEPMLSATAPLVEIEAPSVVDRMYRPHMYFRQVPSANEVKKVFPVDSTDDSSLEDVPLFTKEELEPTYRHGPNGSVLGCPHYARGCKVRHPKSGRLYTCRLCCTHGQQEKDEPLNRYDVTEVLCMSCKTLQPAEDRCINTDCPTQGKTFSKYYCGICHLYDGGERPIFHCPYCNACRLGKGLGIDYRHCMRCNACVSLDDDNHQCIPQKLEGNCPICHEMLFQSTEPLRGLKCGHVMHLSCYNDYCRGHHYTCPLCLRSMDDMTDYFNLLDTAVRMQPMPPNFQTTSIIYCQDCGKTGQTTYHFVGQKCPECGSYNTRELSRT